MVGEDYYEAIDGDEDGSFHIPAADVATHATTVRANNSGSESRLSSSVQKATTTTSETVTDQPSTVIRVNEEMKHFKDSNDDDDDDDGDEDDDDVDEKDEDDDKDEEDEDTHDGARKVAEDEHEKGQSDDADGDDDDDGDAFDDIPKLHGLSHLRCSLSLFMI